MALLSWLKYGSDGSIGSFYVKLIFQILNTMKINSKFLWKICSLIFRFYPINKKESGLDRDLNPGPLAPEARIIPLDHRAVIRNLQKNIIQTLHTLNLSESGTCLHGSSPSGWPASSDRPGPRLVVGRICATSGKILRTAGLDPGAGKPSKTELETLFYNQNRAN